MTARPKVIKPDARENKTTIQVTREIKEALTKIGLKSESYNQIIGRLISNFEKNNINSKGLLSSNKTKPASGQIKIGENITLSKYERITISIKDKINAQQQYIGSSPTLTLEVSYNKPIRKEDELYQIDLKIDKVIFDNEAYSPPTGTEEASPGYLAAKQSCHCYRRCQAGKKRKVEDKEVGSEFIYTQC